MLTVVTIRLDTKELARKAALSAKLAVAAAVYDDAAVAANELLDQANEKVAAAAKAVNEVLAEVNAFANRIHDELQRRIAAMGDGWRETAAGEAVERWREVWEKVNTDPLTTPRFAGYDEAPEHLRDVLDDVADTSPAPRE